VDYVTGDQVIAFVLGGKIPTTEETDWADACAAAVNAGINQRLGSAAAAIVDPSPAFSELSVLARIGASEAYKRKEATFGLTGYSDINGAAVRVAKDYLEGVRPIIDRWGSGPGIG